MLNSEKLPDTPGLYGAGEMFNSYTGSSCVVGWWVRTSAPPYKNLSDEEFSTLMHGESTRYGDSAYSKFIATSTKCPIAFRRAFKKACKELMEVRPELFANTGTTSELEDTFKYHVAQCATPDGMGHLMDAFDSSSLDNVFFQYGSNLRMKLVQRTFEIWETKNAGS